VQTAEGALNEVHTMLTRMRDLAVQAANTGGNDAASRTAAQSEITQLATEITRVSVDTKFGGTSLLDGSYGATAGKLSSFDANGSLTFAAGNTINVNVTGGSGAVSVSLSAGTFTGSAAAASIESSVKAALYATGNATDKAAADGFKSTFDAVGAGGAFTFANSSTAAIAVTDGTGTPLLAAANGLSGLVGTVAAATGSGGNFQIGANSGQLVSVSITSTSAATLGVNALVVTTDAGAAAALTSLDTAIASVSSTRGTLGAMQNRFDSMINNLQVTTENLSASESRIRDTDMAQEMVTLTKNQVLLQAGTAMLAQANQIPQSVLKLLQ
jgi:flagellin